MAGVDRRTRFDDEVAAVDAATFLGHQLAELAAARPDLVTAAAGLDLRPLVVVVGDDPWTLRRTDEGRLTVEHHAAADARSEVRVSPTQFADLVNDLVTPIGLFTAGTLDQPRGRIGRFLDWWLVLRSLLDGEPVYRPGTIDLPDDLGRSFTLDDDPAEVRAFLEAAGFLHLRGVFSAAEMAAISADMDAAADAYHPGDGNSWWATVADGSERLVRMQRFDQRSPATAALLDDPRFLALGDLCGCGHSVFWSADDNRIEALFKPLGVTGGISDVPWHKDCSLGRHSYDCCMLTVGVSVTGGGPTSGQLRVVAGSHRALVWPSLLDTTTLDLPDVALPTETGDVTVHLSCTLHMAQPPTATERRVLYTGFGLPPRNPDAARAGRMRLGATARESAPTTTNQPPAA